MPPGEGDLSDVSPLEDPAGDGGAPGNLTSDAVRNSPEYKELARQNRLLARQAGSATREAETARGAAERARAAAEAESQADLERELMESLGEDGVAAYNEIAELSQTDPRAAARRMAALLKSRGQTPADVIAAATEQPAETEEGNLAPAVPQPPRGVDAGAPLSQGVAVDPNVAIAADLEKTYSDVVARNQDPRLRTRVTMKDRANGLIAYLGAAYIKSGAKPKGS